MTSSSRRWPAIRSSRVVVPDHVVFRELADETIVLNIDTGSYHSVDRIGGRFFELMREVPALEEATPVLAAEFDQPASVIQRDLAAFCDQLLELGLIELAVTDP